MIELPVISTASNEYIKKPNWLRVKLPVGKDYANVRKIVDENKLHTICESGNCPNMGECWGAGTATFMILGNVCTRSCTFCAVATQTRRNRPAQRAKTPLHTPSVPVLSQPLLPELL